MLPALTLGSRFDSQEGNQPRVVHLSRATIWRTSCPSFRRSALCSAADAMMVTRFSCRLQEIESRLVQNERRTDNELRKLHLKRKETCEQRGSRRASDAEKQPTAGGFAGLRRSATDFFRLKSRGVASSTDLTSGIDMHDRHKIKPPMSPADVAGKSRLLRNDEVTGSKESLSQRLQRNSRSVFRVATSRIPSREFAFSILRMHV